jgi:hypothetical protein
MLCGFYLVFEAWLPGFGAKMQHIALLASDPPPSYLFSILILFSKS